MPEELNPVMFRGARPGGTRTAGFPSRSALGDRYYLALFRTDVLGARPNDPVVAALFEHMGCPAGDARADEDRREQLGGDAPEVISGGMVEVGVGEELLLDR